MSYIVITGSPVNGHAFIGTFPTHDDAVAEARTWSDTDWWVVELEAPESVANVSEASQEPGNATEPRRHDERCTAGPWLYAPGRCNCGAEADAEVAAALRVYRKVQACTVDQGNQWLRAIRRRSPGRDLEQLSPAGLAQGR